MQRTSLSPPGQHLAYLESVTDRPLPGIGRAGWLASGIIKALLTVFTTRGTEGAFCGFCPEFSEVC